MVMMTVNRERSPFSIFIEIAIERTLHVRAAVDHLPGEISCVPRAGPFQLETVRAWDPVSNETGFPAPTLDPTLRNAQAPDRFPHGLQGRRTDRWGVANLYFRHANPTRAATALSPTLARVKQPRPLRARRRKMPALRPTTPRPPPEKGIRPRAPRKFDSEINLPPND
jgi:hypothetical protein